ncbi:hypothetical protein [Mycobacterium sp. 852002-51057_SCH5723018]|uniref:hypothetical protein n=1 Tax=Mycobacterium sp. 852002-51057_SCH5723018 TaxID=1834094 RepID=UPI0012E74E74|nr:hypothetical protein [Mycobacterium sp. 852002-51057_SCH5723018]
MGTELITQAYMHRAWDALGYSSWDDYCIREFGTTRLRLPREERAEVVTSLRESGLRLKRHTARQLKRGLLSLRVQPGSKNWDVADVFAVPLVNRVLVAAVTVEESTVNPRNPVEVVGQLFARGSGRHDRSHDF